MLDFPNMVLQILFRSTLGYSIGLCFVGVPLAVPCPVPLMEAQARYIASYLNWELTTADREESETWLASRKVEVGNSAVCMKCVGSSKNT
jgi:hypothetical protein